MVSRRPSPGVKPSVNCADTGGALARQEVLTSAATADPGIMLEVIRLSERGERFLRVRRPGPSPDKPALAAAVYAATDDFLANASDADLDRIIDLGFAPPMSMWAFFANVLVWHAATHQGEVSALKGVQGLNGLDMSH